MTAAEPVRIAVFDLDGTVLDCESQELFVRFLMDKRIAPMSLIMEVALWFTLHRLGWRFDVPKVHLRLVRRFAGIPPEALGNAIQEFSETTLKVRIRKDAERWVSRVRAEGCHIVLLSASLETMVAGIAESMDVDGYWGTKLNFGPGKLSVKGEMVYGEAKLRALRSYADLRFSSWRLEYAFGNDYADRFLLSEAAVPIAVCPSHRLREFAQKNGWDTAIWT